MDTVLHKILKENLNNRYDVKILKTKEEISEYIDDIWYILQKSYGEGNFKTARNAKSLLKSINLVKCVFTNNKLIACATYRNIGGYKMNAIGCDQSVEGAKEALQAIIEHDIENYKGWYWAEVSGAIEHYFKKYNGYPIPNFYASELLGKDVKLNEDGVHYERPIGIDGDIFTKAIYGFKSEEFLNKIITELDNYEEFMHKVNSLKETITHYGIEIHKATYIIENIYRSHTEDEVNELPLTWRNALIDSKKVLEMSQLLNDKEEIKWYKDMAGYLLDWMPLLKINKF